MYTYLFDQLDEACQSRYSTHLYPYSCWSILHPSSAGDLVITLTMTPVLSPQNSKTFSPERSILSEGAK